jgi:hypothetical protein
VWESSGERKIPTPLWNRKLVIIANLGLQCLVTCIGRFNHRKKNMHHVMSCLIILRCIFHRNTISFFSAPYMKCCYHYAIKAYRGHKSRGNFSLGTRLGVLFASRSSRFTQAKSPLANYALYRRLDRSQIWLAYSVEVIILPLVGNQISDIQPLVSHFIHRYAPLSRQKVLVIKNLCSSFVTGSLVRNTISVSSSRT